MAPSCLAVACKVLLELFPCWGEPTARNCGCRCVLGGASWVPAMGGLGCWGSWWLHSPRPSWACWREGGSVSWGTEAVRRGHEQGQGSKERMQAGTVSNPLSHTGKRLHAELFLPLHTVGHVWRLSRPRSAPRKALTLQPLFGDGLSPRGSPGAEGHSPSSARSHPRTLFR